jgi:branched-chain amino acid transport system permease protein
MVTLSGALLTYYLTVASETSFNFQVILNYAIIVVVGGFTSIQGAILGALFFNSAPVIISWLTTNAPGVSQIEYLQNNSAQLQLIVFGLVVVVVLTLWPAGLAGAWRAISHGRRRGGKGTSVSFHQDGEAVAK